jgi:class 3 adenylate cyclase
MLSQRHGTLCFCDHWVMKNMALRELHYRWEWQLKSSPEDLWTLVADTNRLDRDAGHPKLQSPSEDSSPSLPNARLHLRFSRLGVPVEWEEQPYQWVRPYRYGVNRFYSRGPFKSTRALVQLNRRADGGTHMIFENWVTPKNLFGLMAAMVQVGVLSARGFDKAIRSYDAMSAQGQSVFDLPGEPEFPPGGRQRLAALRQALLDRKQPPLLVERLAKLIEGGDDLTLDRLRPYALADCWGVPRRMALELCLWATRVGLLDFRWDLLCPLCRGAKASASTLADIQPEVHCDTCNIDYKVNFDRSVELTFRPNQAVRVIAGQKFCMAGPTVTPHIVVQQLLPSGTSRDVTVELEPGRYRLRTLGLRGGQFLQVTPNSPLEASVTASNEGWPEDEKRLGQRPTIHLDNRTDSEQLFIFERTIWSDQAVTGAEVTALQLFRDLFTREALRPGEQMSVGSLTILFTDLRHSTMLYREIGDAPAFGMVMDHFDVLHDAIAAEEGAMVKTIGDAVMAAFQRPASALRAARRVQEKLATPPNGMQPLMLKAGIHTGPCIAVTLNDRLDYFGTTVNMASRLEGLSSGDDVIISDAVRADPEILDMLSLPESGLSAEPFEATLKGFDVEKFSLWRIAAAQIPVKVQS